MDDLYQTITGSAQGLYKDKGSKFLAFAHHVESEEEVKQIVEAARKEYFDARHHCYAYVLGTETQRYRENDDGEPSGTAGRPIHGQILSLGLTNTLVVVVRYFGGILLGTSGLITAYKEASKDALSHAAIVQKTIDQPFRVRFEYTKMNEVMRILKEFDLTPRNQQYDMDCRLEVSVRKSLAVRFEETIQKIYGADIERL